MICSISISLMKFHVHALKISLIFLILLVDYYFKMDDISPGPDSPKIRPSNNALDPLTITQMGESFDAHVIGFTRIHPNFCGGNYC